MGQPSINRGTNVTIAKAVFKRSQNFRCSCEFFEGCSSLSQGGEVIERVRMRLDVFGRIWIRFKKFEQKFVSEIFGQKFLDFRKFLSFSEVLDNF